MRIGNLDRRITIQSNTPSQDSYGEPIASWSELDVVWAQVTVLGGRGDERFVGEQDYATHRAEFRIRYRSDVTAAMRISYDSLVWLIESVVELGRQEGTLITATAQVA